MSRQSFTNRHGHKLTVDDTAQEVVVETGQAAKKPIAPVPAESARPAEQSRTFSRPQLQIPAIKPRFSKKLLLILLVLLVVLGLGVVMIADATKRGYERQTAAMKRNVNDLTTKTFSTEISARDAIKGISSQLTADSTCSGNELVLQFYSAAQQTHQECVETAKAYKGLHSSVTAMSQMVDYLDKQKVILQDALTPPQNGAFAEIPQELEVWQTAYDKLLFLSAPAPVKDIHTNLTKNVQEVLASWQAIQNAHNAQDAAAFAEGEARLAKAYEALRVSGEEIEGVVSGLQKDIQTRVAQLR